MTQRRSLPTPGSSWRPRGSTCSSPTTSAAADIGFDADGQRGPADRPLGRQPRAYRACRSPRWPTRSSDAIPRAARQPPPRAGPFAERADPRAALADALRRAAATLALPSRPGQRAFWLPERRLPPDPGRERCGPQERAAVDASAASSARPSKHDRLRLRQSRGRPGSSPARGPAPTRTREGLPSSAGAGQLLTKMLESVKVSRDEVSHHEHGAVPAAWQPQPRKRTSWPPAPRFSPTSSAVIQPKVILTPGSVATQAMLRTKEPIGKLRGRCTPTAPRCSSRHSTPRSVAPATPAREYKRMAMRIPSSAKRE